MIFCHKLHISLPSHHHLIKAHFTLKNSDRFAQCSLFGFSPALWIRPNHFSKALISITKKKKKKRQLYIQKLPKGPYRAPILILYYLLNIWKQWMCRISQHFNKVVIRHRNLRNRNNSDAEKKSNLGCFKMRIAVIPENL